MNYFNRIEDINPEYYEEASQKGTMERLDYKAINYDGQEMDKHAYVYLPYGYDATKPYEILYFLHGSQETAEKYFYQGGEENPLKRAVDNMIEKGDIEPVIIVTPTEYPFHQNVPSGINSRPFTEYFHNELVEKLLPAVESKYHTYADFTVDPETLVNTRGHRSVMGWSMGSKTTWWVFMHRLANFSKIGFLSGGCGEIEGDLTKEWADETAKVIVESIKASGYTKEDYAIYAISGTLDSAFMKLNLQMGALLAYPEYFDFYSDKQNATFLVWPNGEHHTQWRLQYSVNAIKQFFKK